MRRWEGAIILAGLLLAGYAGVGVMLGVWVMEQQDCLAMEELLAGEGYRVKVEAGTLVQAGGETWALLRVKLQNGEVTTARYRLGPRGQVAARLSIIGEAMR